MSAAQLRPSQVLLAELYHASQPAFGGEASSLSVLRMCLLSRAELYIHLVLPPLLPPPHPQQPSSLSLASFDGCSAPHE